MFLCDTVGNSDTDAHLPIQGLLAAAVGPYRLGWALDESGRPGHQTGSGAPVWLVAKAFRPDLVSSGIFAPASPPAKAIRFFQRVLSAPALRASFVPRTRHIFDTLLATQVPSKATAKSTMIQRNCLCQNDLPPKCPVSPTLLQHRNPDSKSSVLYGRVGSNPT